jgi:hypothetical protein
VVVEFLVLASAAVVFAKTLKQMKLIVEVAESSVRK